LRPTKQGRDAAGRDLQARGGGSGFVQIAHRHHDVPAPRRQSARGVQPRQIVLYPGSDEFKLNARTTVTNAARLLSQIRARAA
jgi:hypothetical protein